MYIEDTVRTQVSILISESPLLPEFISLKCLQVIFAWDLATVLFSRVSTRRKLAVTCRSFVKARSELAKSIAL